MKILKKEDVSKWAMLHKCCNCDSDLEIESADLKCKRYHGYYNEPSYNVYVTNCAVCKQQIEFQESKIPKLVQLDAKTRKSE